MKHLLSSIVFVLVFFSTAWAQENWEVWGENLAETVKELNTTGLSVAIVNKDGIVYKASYGFANADKKSKLTTEHIFNIASCSKAFTAASVAQLVEEGRCDWDDKVIDYLPSFRLADPYITDNLTIRDLFCHRSGFSTFTGDLLWYGTEYTDQEVFDRLRYQPIDQPFRYSFGYQNNMYTVAGMLIEALTGKDWSTYIAEHWFTPLAMSNTYPSNDELNGKEKIAEPHYHQKAIAGYDFNSAKPAASIHSNVEDLAKWAQLWLNNGIVDGDTLLTESAIRNLWQAHTPTPVSARQEEWGTNFSAYALGWKVYDYHGSKVVEHDGGMPGYISKVTIMPQDGYAIICLNNGYDFFVNSIARYTAMDLIHGADERTDWASFYTDYQKRYAQYLEKTAADRLATKIPNTLSMSLESYEGKFNDDTYGTATVKKEGDHLTFTLDAAAKLFSGKLTHWHYNTFRWDHNDPFLTFGLVTFEVDALGKIDGFKIDLPNDDFHFYQLDFKKVVEGK